MQNINYTEELKKSIEVLEVEQDLSRYLLKEQFNTTYERLKPVNLLTVSYTHLTLPTIYSV